MDRTKHRTLNERKAILCNLAPRNQDAWIEIQQARTHVALDAVEASLLLRSTRYRDNNDDPYLPEELVRPIREAR